MIFRVPASRQLIYNAPMMDVSVILQAVTVALFFPGLRSFFQPGRDEPIPMVWQVLPAAAAALWCIFAAADGWREDVSYTLWVSSTTVLILHLIFALRSETMRRLAGLVLCYGCIACLLSALAGMAGVQRLGMVGGWIVVHIVIALSAYGLITLASIAALSVVLKERALKSRQINRFTSSLPAVVMGEGLQFRLLIMGEAVLAAGLVTGISVQVSSDLPVFSIDHKTILLVGTFVLIAFLLIIQQMFGYRGRRASSLVLIVCLLITLAFPGVKFVSDVLIAAG